MISRIEIWRRCRQCLLIHLPQFCKCFFGIKFGRVSVLSWSVGSAAFQTTTSLAFDEYQKQTLNCSFWIIFKTLVYYLFGSCESIFGHYLLSSFKFCYCEGRGRFYTLQCGFVRSDVNRNKRPTSSYNSVQYRYAQAAHANGICEARIRQWSIRYYLYPLSHEEQVGRVDQTETEIDLNNLTGSLNSVISFILLSFHTKEGKRPALVVAW